MTSTFADTTRDAFLGGRLVLEQPRGGYRAGIDPVLLAAFVPARAGQTVLDLGCGAGAALFCLATRVPGLDLTGVEMQAPYAALARANAARNGLTARIATADLCDLPADLRQRRFDHVLMNPPYHDRTRGTAAEDPGRDIARGEGAPLADWIATGARRLAPGGWMHVIQAADRLADVLTAVAAHLGSVTVHPLIPRTGRSASLIVVQARKGGRAPLILAAPLVLHDGPRHQSDGKDYAPAIRAALRDAAMLPE